jgi:hypothetical protein
VLLGCESAADMSVGCESAADMSARREVVRWPGVLVVEDGPCDDQPGAEQRVAELQAGEPATGTVAEQVGLDPRQPGFPGGRLRRRPPIRASRGRRRRAGSGGRRKSRSPGWWRGRSYLAPTPPRPALVAGGVQGCVYSTSFLLVAVRSAPPVWCSREWDATRRTAVKRQAAGDSLRRGPPMNACVRRRPAIRGPPHDMRSRSVVARPDRPRVPG